MQCQRIVSEKQQRSRPKMGSPLGAGRFSAATSSLVLDVALRLRCRPRSSSRSKIASARWSPYSLPGPKCCAQGRRIPHLPRSPVHRSPMRGRSERGSFPTRSWRSAQRAGRHPVTRVALKRARLGPRPASWSSQPRSRARASRAAKTTSSIGILGGRGSDLP